MAGKGAPLGNKNNTKNRPWSEAIRKALLAEDGRKLRAIADKIVELAMDGDMQAIRELGDRIDGKSIQAAVISGDPENPLFISEITRKIIRSE